MGVEVVAEQQRFLRRGRREQPRPAVVQQVALVDRLHAERTPLVAERREDGLEPSLLLGSQRSRPERALRGARPPPRRPRGPGSAAEEPPRRLDGAVDLFVAVRERDEHRLVLRRRDVDAAREEAAEQRAVRARRRTPSRLQIENRPLPDEQRQHRADALDASERGQPGLEPRRALLELVVDVGGRGVVGAPPGRRRSPAGSPTASRPGTRRQRAQAAPSPRRCRRRRPAAGRRRRSCRGSVRSGATP